MNLPRMCQCSTCGGVFPVDRVVLYKHDGLERVECRHCEYTEFLTDELAATERELNELKTRIAESELVLQ